MTGLFSHMHTHTYAHTKGKTGATLTKVVPLFPMNEKRFQGRKKKNKTKLNQRARYENKHKCQCICECIVRMYLCKFLMLYVCVLRTYKEPPLRRPQRSIRIERVQ